MSDYPNIEAIAAGTISGAFREWPRVRTEARELLQTVEDERKYRLQNAEYAAGLEAEVERLEGLIAGHEAWVDADPDQWVMRKDTRIRAALRGGGMGERYQGQVEWRVK